MRSSSLARARINRSWVAYNANKEIDTYMRRRAWHWALSKNYAITADYCIRLLNRHPRDVVALVLGELSGRETNQSEFAQKCREALQSLKQREKVDDVVGSLVKEPFALDLKAFLSQTEAQHKAAGEGGTVATGWEDEKIVVSESAPLSEAQKSVRRACERAGSTTAAAEVLQPRDSSFGRGLFATRRIPARQVILLDRPLLTQRMDDAHCAHCLAPLSSSSGGSVRHGTDGNDMENARGVPCEHCDDESYCSPECRDAAWKQYHACCCSSVNPSFGRWAATMREGVAAVTASDTSSVARASLSCLAVAKLCAMGTVRATHPLGLEGVRCLRGVAEYDPQTALSEIGALAVTLGDALHQPQLHLEEVLSLFALLQTNEFLQNGGIALYPVLSLLNHSCVPNCVIARRSDTDRQLIALNDIRDGEQLYIDYNSSLTTTLDYEQRKALCAQRYFECFCAKCIRQE